MRVLAATSLVLFLVGCPNPNGGDSGKSTDGNGALGDEDGDGFRPSEGDCDEKDASINPGAEEICDGVDNNCDGTVDEGVGTAYYADADEDGFGDPNTALLGCEAPDGYVENGDDCDDGNKLAFPENPEVCDGIDNDCDGAVDDGVGTTYYPDADSDGYGDPASSITACDVPVGYVLDSTDCDDTNEKAYPGNVEVCDLADNDCDGDVDEGTQTTYYADVDEDGYGDPTGTQLACSLPTGYSEDDTDCDDARAETNPGAPELCNGFDDDCDGDIDEDSAGDATNWYADADGDTYGDPNVFVTSCAPPAGYVADGTDCDDGRADSNPGALEYCNGFDDDCDGSVDEGSAVDATTWYYDADGDAYGIPSVSVASCSQPAGYVADGTDCNDGRSASHPGATEYCNGYDDDCDGTTDEGDSVDATIWYADADADLYGDPSVAQNACAQPAGYVADATDCDDARAATNPGASEYCNGIDDDCDGSVDEGAAVDGTTWYADTDGDSYGDASLSQNACSQPAGYVADGTDCDDGRAATHPGASEYCNGIDDDCDGTVDETTAVDASTWYYDADADTYGNASVSTKACTRPAGYVGDATDCNDGRAESHPGAVEYCNGYDDDCDGTVDEADAADAGTWYADADIDGYGNPSVSTDACSAPAGYVADNADCDDARAATNPGASEYCNGIDDDCDGTTDESSAVDAGTWYRDADSDTYGNSSLSTTSCSAPSGYVADNTDCNDSRAATNPGAPEYCNGIDDDCDGTTDESSAVDASIWYVDADSDTYGSASTSTLACTQPAGYVANSTDCNDTTSAAHPGASEICDGIDNDCDGSVDEAGATGGATWYADTDGDTYGNPSSSTTSCTAPAGYVADATDCNDSRADTHPGASEYCNSIDDDCNGTVDDSYAVDASAWYADADADTYGNAASSRNACSQPSGYVTDSTDCNDTFSAAHPGATEICDGIDNDCDGSIDEAGGVTGGDTYYADADGDDFGDEGSTIVACSLPSGYVDNYWDCNDSDATEPVAVDDGGSAGAAGTYSDPLDTLQAGVDQADQCVVVFAGAYAEYDIDFSTKSLDVWGVDGYDTTTVDAGLTTCTAANPTECHSVFLFASGTGAASTVHGFTVSGGTGHVSSSASVETCADSSPSGGGSETCTVTTYDYCGGGAYVEGDDPAFSDMVFSNNNLPVFDQVTTGSWSQTWLESSGGGVCALGSNATFDSVVFASNYADTGGGLYDGQGSVLTLVHGWFDDNTALDGGGIATDDADLAVTNTVLACNAADTDGGGFFSETGGTSTFTNVVVAYNTAGTAATNGSQTYSGAATSLTLYNLVAQANTASPMFRNAGSATIAYADVKNLGAGGTTSGVWSSSSVTGNGSQYTSISCDSDWTNDNAHLRSGAASINAGNPAAAYNDTDGTRNDLGAYGGPDGSW